MKAVHLGAAALNTTPGDWEGNTRLILEAIEAAKQKGVGLLCLPELCITGYGCEDSFHASFTCERARDILTDQILPATVGIAVAVGLPFEHCGCTYNSIAMLADGTIGGFAMKRNLAGDGLHYETRFFKAWPAGERSRIQIMDTYCDIGDVVFDFNGIRVGLEICEDAWVAGRPGVDLARCAVDIILNPSASHFAFRKMEVRTGFVCEGSRAFQCAYVYANLLGNESGRTIYDGDCLIASSGEIHARSQIFGFDRFRLTTAIVDLEENRVARKRQASFTPLTAEDTSWTPINWDVLSARTPNVNDRVKTQALPTDELNFQRAVGLGLFDYMRKSHTRGFAISLSGGADSAACLMLVYLMVVDLVESAPTHPYVHQLLDGDTLSLANLMQRICVCAYQATDNSSQTTENAARQLAEATGARFTSLNVQPIVEAYEAMLATYLGRPLDWTQDDVSRQNIQARSRAPGIWAIANAENFLVLTTSNRSEAAVGYCTMDGDTAGSLAPLGGIDKPFLLRWLRWAEARYLPALCAVNCLSPTAELRPEAAAQTDEQDLMPYTVLNRIQKLAVVQKKSPLDIYRLLRVELPAAAPMQIYEWIERYCQLWSRNQWKRERYAPSFHVDDENLDPRSWCRFPILSGGYAAELAELKQIASDES